MVHRCSAAFRTSPPAPLSAVWPLEATWCGEMLRISLGSTRIQFTTRHMHSTENVKKGANTMHFALKLAVNHHGGLIQYSTKAKNLEQASNYPITTHPQTTKTQAQVIHTRTTAMSSHGRGEAPNWKIPNGWNVRPPYSQLSRRGRSRPSWNGSPGTVSQHRRALASPDRTDDEFGSRATHNK